MQSGPSVCRTIELDDRLIRSVVSTVPISGRSFSERFCRHYRTSDSYGINNQKWACLRDVRMLVTLKTHNIRFKKNWLLNFIIISACLGGGVARDGHTTATSRQARSCTVNFPKTRPFKRRLFLRSAFLSVRFRREATEERKERALSSWSWRNGRKASFPTGHNAIFSQFRHDMLRSTLGFFKVTIKKSIMTWRIRDRGQ